MNINNSKVAQERIRKLGVRKRELEKRKDVLKHNQEKNIAAMTETNTELKSVNIQLTELSKKKFAPLVSEHALVRYLERLKSIDVEAIRKIILPEKTIEQILTLGDGRYPVEDFIVVVVNNTVVTVLTYDGQAS